jgi:hypothetical protein
MKGSESGSSEEKTAPPVKVAENAPEAESTSGGQG